jgi:hypothetical protein
MQAGWPTATLQMREMEFGAGMGLPNLKKKCLPPPGHRHRSGQGH